MTTRGRKRRCASLATWIALSVTSACDEPAHPNNPQIPAILCESRCRRENDCDAKVDFRSCVARCERYLTPRAIYDRMDLVEAFRACAAQQACVPEAGRAISECRADSFRRLEPSAAVRTYCQKAVEKDQRCGEASPDYDHCIYGNKVYSDVILRQMTACLDDHPCRTYGLCLVAVVGEDQAIQDPDRQAAFRHKLLPDAAPASVTLQGRVNSEGDAPIAGANVCIRNPDPGACVTTNEAGDFLLSVPGHQEFAVSAQAPGFVGRLVALTSAGQDFNNWTIILPDEALGRARYSGFGATFPDAATGFVFATAHAPAGSRHGLEGVTMVLNPASGKGPLFFNASSEPDPQRKATSTWSSGMFANVQPGEVELTFGAESITCTPWYGGWPSKQANSVRIPIVAGFETRVTMNCHH